MKDDPREPSSLLMHLAQLDQHVRLNDEEYLELRLIRDRMETAFMAGGATLNALIAMGVKQIPEGWRLDPLTRTIVPGNLHFLGGYA